MGIKKGLAVLLVFGLLLMGVTPVLAAGEQVKAAATAQQGEVVRMSSDTDISLPRGEEIADSLLYTYVGQKVIKTIDDAFETAIKIAAGAAFFADDAGGNVFNDVVAVGSLLSGGKDLMETLAYYGAKLVKRLTGR